MATQLIVRRAFSGLVAVTPHDAELIAELPMQPTLFERENMNETKPTEKICENCGLKFQRDTRSTWMRWAQAKYCGKKCSGIGVAKTKDKNRPSIEEKFWSLVTISDGCWLWQGGGRDKDGYGLMEYQGKMLRATALSLSIDGRPVPKGQYACHTCDNPPCVRPDHLYPGTPTQNMADAIARGRLRVGEQCHQAKLTEKDVRAIREARGTHAEIAVEYGVSDSTVGLIKQRRIWKHVA